MKGRKKNPWNLSSDAALRYNQSCNPVAETQAWILSLPVVLKCRKFLVSQ